MNWNMFICIRYLQTPQMSPFCTVFLILSCTGLLLAMYLWKSNRSMGQLPRISGYRANKGTATLVLSFSQWLLFRWQLSFGFQYSVVAECSNILKAHTASTLRWQLIWMDADVKKWKSICRLSLVEIMNWKLHSNAQTLRPHLNNHRPANYSIRSTSYFSH